MLMSAFDPLEEILFVVTAPIVAVPVIVGPLMVGVVIILFVKVCEPVSVATVESIANVTALPDPDVSIPVPPVNVIVSLSKSIDSAPPESAWKSKSSAVICVAIYALIDCCVASEVALSLPNPSSSSMLVTVAPLVPILRFSSTTVPVPDALILKSSLLLLVEIPLSLIVMSFKIIPPVPDV